MIQNPKISAIVLTFNEEMHIARCILNLQKIATEIFVVDSFSADRTCEIAEELGVQVVQHKYINQAQQFQWALDTLHCSGEWVLRMDADEYLSDELIAEIQSSLPSIPPDVNGCNLSRDVIFLEKKLRFGRLRPPQILRLWRKGGVYMEQRWMDEQCILKHGRAITLKGHFVDHNLNGLTWWTQKHNHYSNRELAVEIGRRYGIFADQENPKQGARNCKKNRYYKLPPFFRAFSYFLIRYVFLGGFLDGRPGLIWAGLQAFWYRFLIDAKIYEMETVLKGNVQREQLKQYLKNNLDLKI